MSDKKILVGDMSRETAIGILKLMSEAMEVYDSIAPTPQRRNAVQMAIASLETDEAYQLEYEQPEISKGLFEQIKWERDIAIEQLRELGYEFGEKIEESVLPKAKWIPVTTRKPRLEERVLIFTEDGKIEIAYRDNIPWTENQYEYVVISMLGYRFSYEEDKVLAWMPLPTPYEPQKSEDKE